MVHAEFAQAHQKKEKKMIWRNINGMVIEYTSIEAIWASKTLWV